MGGAATGWHRCRAPPLFLRLGNSACGLSAGFSTVCKCRRLDLRSFGCFAGGVARSISNLGTRVGTNSEAGSQRGASSRSGYHCVGRVGVEFIPADPSPSARPPSTLCPGTIGGITSGLGSPGSNNDGFGVAAVASSRSGIPKVDHGGGTSAGMKSNLVECFWSKTV